MDFKDDAYDEEVDLQSYKITPSKTAKLAFKSVFYFFVLVIYGLLMLRFFVSCDLGMVDKAHFSDKAREIYTNAPDSFETYNIHTPITFNEQKSLNLKTIVYSPTVNELEIGVKFKKTITGGSTEPLLEYELVDSDGNSYEIASRISDNRYDYGYERISFKGVKLDLDKNIVNIYESIVNDSDAEYNRNVSYDESTYELSVEQNDDPDNVKYKLYVKYKGERVRLFLLYDDFTPISEYKFKP